MFVPISPDLCIPTCPKHCRHQSQVLSSTHCPDCSPNRLYRGEPGIRTPHHSENSFSSYWCLVFGMSEWDNCQSLFFLLDSHPFPTKHPYFYAISSPCEALLQPRPGTSLLQLQAIAHCPRAQCNTWAVYGETHSTNKYKGACGVA